MKKIMFNDRYGLTEEGYSEMLCETEHTNIIESVVKMIEILTVNNHPLNYDKK